jgi:hypothetical protein
MPTWNQHSIHKHMHVFSADQQDLGHVTEVYEDSFRLHKGFLFTKDRYFPYNTIASVDKDRIYLNLSADRAQETLWEKRPDYEDHPGDPTQLFYDRGHGIPDPFDETNPGRT